MFEEGSSGREVFIVQEGLLGVYKRDEDREIELARIGKNSVVGEMSLLDKQPRSATVKALEDSKVAVINELVFNQTLQKAPPWLTSLIKIVVSRLRDTNKRVNAPVLTDKKFGLTMLLHLLSQEKDFQPLSYNSVLVEAFYVCRLKKGDTKDILSDLKNRGIICLEPEEQPSVIKIPLKDIFELYCEYLKLKKENKKFKEALLTDEEFKVISNIDYIAQKKGKKEDNSINIEKGIIINELSGGAIGDRYEKIINDIRRKGMINIDKKNEREYISFSPESFSRIKKIKEWLPKFEA